MKTTTKRLLSVLLAVMMVLGVFGMCAFADEIDPDDYVKYNSWCSEAGSRHDPAVNGFMVLVKDYSCTEGLKEFYKLYYCEACGKTIKKSYTNAATGKPEIQPHSFVDVYGKDPTCTENGLTDGVACKVCGKVKVEQKVIKARHTDNNDDGYCDICKAETRYHCPYCNQEHAGFFGAFVKIFHNILASFGMKKK